jgi:hypothetical protein
MGCEMATKDGAIGAVGSEPGDTAGDASARAALRLPVWAWLAIWLVLWVGGSAIAHYALHGVVNGWQLALALFLAVNLMICVWEISLWHRIDDIERWVHHPDEGEPRPRGNLYLASVSLRELASSRRWALVWYGYARYDDGYADRRSFGFAIDVGNGFSTLLPSLFFLVAMTLPVVSPVVLGVVGLLIFYQKFYCTCLYFFTYLFNERYAGHRLGNLLAMVGGTNGIWLVFPAVGIYVCLRLILESSFDVIWS